MRKSSKIKAQISKIKKHTVSCIIPFYNEEERLNDVIDELIKVKDLDQIICVDDHSEDGSEFIVHSPGTEMLSCPITTESVEIMTSIHFNQTFFQDFLKTSALKEERQDEVNRIQNKTGQ